MSDHSSRFLASLAASGVAEVITLPIDVSKVRLQVQTLGGGASVEYKGMVDCMVKIRANEGSKALWKGLTPSLVRQCCYSSCSLVLYEPIRNAVVSATGGLANDGQPNYIQRLVSGGTAGAVSISLFNWTEVIKTRMQTSPTELAMRNVFKEVLASEGPKGFFYGLKPNVMRTFLVNAAELGTYDQAKTAMIPVVGDNAFAHLGASSLSGVCSALVSTPADVIKTRLMNGAGQGAKARQYKGVVDAGTSIVREEGASALYKGFIPICVRKVIWCSSFFVLYEQFRSQLS